MTTVLIADDQPLQRFGFRMPSLDGIEATRRITAAGARTRVLILTRFDIDEYAYAGSSERAGR